MAALAPTTKEIILDEISQTIGKDAIAAVEPTNVEPSDGVGPVTKFKSAPTCRTQKPIPRAIKKGPAALMVGLNAECPRWAPGSVIRWAAWRAGFDSQEDADYAAEQLQMAAEVWNKCNIGVTFEWVPLAKDATFVLVHGGDEEGTLAQAFFPSANDLDYVYVHTLAFDIAWKSNMWRVFMHELGHVLGLRHEFALVEGEGAVQIGPRNERSVMNYRREPPEMQETDIESTRAFYALSNDANGKLPKVGMTEVKDYVPM
jgi:hypothetical protein